MTITLQPHTFAGGPPANATCRFYQYATWWYNNAAYDAVEATCDYGPSANMQASLGTMQHDESQDVPSAVQA